MPVFDSVGGRNAIPSGLSHQNLVWTIVSLFRSSRANFDSVCVSGRFISRSLTVFHIEFFVRFNHCKSSLNSSRSSCQIVSRFFSPEIHMNLQLRPVVLVPRGSTTSICGELLCGSLPRVHTCVGYYPDPVPGDLLPTEIGSLLSRGIWTGLTYWTLFLL